MQLKEVEGMWKDLEKTLKSISSIEKYLSDAREALIQINNLQMKSRIFCVDSNALKDTKYYISAIVDSIEAVIKMYDKSDVTE